jgi:hypothetical protein
LASKYFRKNWPRLAASDATKWQIDQGRLAEFRRDRQNSLLRLGVVSPADLSATTPDVTRGERQPLFSE